MGYRDRTASERSGASDFCIMEVRHRKKGSAPGTEDTLRLMMVDSHWDTLRFVQDNMDHCVSNLVRLKRLPPSEAQIGVNESAALFKTNLEPLISSMAAAKGKGVMDKLSVSLKKALLLMVMERVQSDREKACQVLGISPEKLETELKLCGVAR